jgi:hypothetical protein
VPELRVLYRSTTGRSGAIPNSTSQVSSPDRRRESSMSCWPATRTRPSSRPSTPATVRVPSSRFRVGKP